MELILTRIAKKKGYTIGRLQTLSDSTDPSRPPLKGEERKSPFKGDLEGLCDTLEPTWRDYEHGAYKIKGKSAIPEGRYAVVISYSPKFKQWLPLLLGGPEFNKKWSGIRIHAGNSAKDTQGCILVGENKEVGKVLNSRKWLYELKRLIVEAKDRGEAVWLTIK